MRSLGSVSVRAMVNAGQVTSPCSFATCTPSAGRSHKWHCLFAGVLRDGNACARPPTCRHPACWQQPLTFDLVEDLFSAALEVRHGCVPVRLCRIKNLVPSSRPPECWNASPQRLRRQYTDMTSPDRLPMPAPHCHAPPPLTAWRRAWRTPGCHLGTPLPCRRRSAAALSHCANPGSSPWRAQTRS